MVVKTIKCIKCKHSMFLGAEMCTAVECSCKCGKYITRTKDILMFQEILDDEDKKPKQLIPFVRETKTKC